MGSIAKNARLHLAALLIILVCSSGIVASCKNQPDSTEDSLPAGFERFELPKMRLTSYLFLDPGYDLTLAPGLLTQGLGNENILAISRIVALSNSDLNAVQIKFKSLKFAQSVFDEIPTADDDKPEVLLNGEDLWLIWEENFSDVPFEQFWSTNPIGDFKENYPQIWILAKMLPEQPPLPPAGVGFSEAPAKEMGSLLTKMGFPGSLLEEAGSLLRINSAVFSLYAEKKDLNPLDLGNLGQRDWSMLSVARSEYPSLVLRMMLNGIAVNGALEKRGFGQQSYYYRYLGDSLHLTVSIYDANIYWVLASNMDLSEELIESLVPNPAT